MTTTASNPIPRSKSTNPVSLTSYALDARADRFINSEYRRGFMEGQHEAAIAFAAVVDSILQKFNHVAAVKRVEVSK